MRRAVPADDHVGLPHVEVFVGALEHCKAGLLELSGGRKLDVVVTEFVEPHVVYFDFESLVELRAEEMVEGAFTSLDFEGEVLVEILKLVFEALLDGRVLFKILVGDACQIDYVGTDPCQSLTVLVHLDQI
jgi:hypothetical protein